MAIGALACSAAAQLPETPTVVHGKVEVTTTGANMTVKQDTKFGIVNWNSFSIGAGNGVLFANGTGATLNRVTGLTPSQIDGTLSATGSLYLLNPNGVIIGTDGRVLTGGSFIASTRDIANADFLNGGGFTLAGDSTAGVTNLGRISSLGGNVLLAGYTVENSGAIDARAGRVGLVAGQRVDVLTDVSWMNGAYAVSLGARGNDVTNTGFLQALVAELRTHNGNIYALAGNNTGLIQATGVRNEGGKVFLTADGGTVQSSGTVVATRAEGVAGREVVNGGDVVISAAAVENYGGWQDVSGASGGTIRVEAESVVTDTTMLARGTTGAGGTISIEASRDLLFTSAGIIDASGVTQGGEVALDVGGGILANSGQVGATASAGPGGRISFLGKHVSLLGALADASGATGGGSIFVGGGYQGGAVWDDATKSPLRDYANAIQTYIGEGSLLRADATGETGNGGTVVVWSDGTTQFAGTIEARSGTESGNGGLVETSGLEGLGVAGTVETAARGATGENGTWLLDPKNITIGTVTDSFSQLRSLVARFGAYATDSATNLYFGTYLDISGGTAVISNAIPNAGSFTKAVYVFEQGQLVARLTSSGSDPFNSWFGAGVGVEGDYVMVLDPREILGFQPPPGQGSFYNTMGTVRVFYKGGGWRNGNGNQVFTLYNSINHNQFGRQMDWDWGAPPVPSGPDISNNSRFDTTVNGFGQILIGVGYPTYDDFQFTDVGMVMTYGFNPGTNQTGLTSSWGTNGPPQGANGLRFGDSLVLSGDWIYVRPATSFSAQQFDLYVRDTFHAFTRFQNFFQNMGTTYLAASNSAFFAVGNDQRLYTATFAAPSDTSFTAPMVLQSGLSVVPLNTTALGGNASTFNNVYSVAVDGDSMIVGNPNYNSSAGAVAIYQRPGASWLGTTLNPVFSYSSFGAGARGGDVVGISGDYAIASAPNFTGNDARRGAATLFQRTSGTWSMLSNLGPGTVHDGTDFGGFGRLAVEGNTIVVADSEYRYLDQSTTGRVYVYENGTLAATLSSPVPFLANFGTAVDIDDNRIAVINADPTQNSWVGLFARGDGWRNGTANFLSGFRGSNATNSLGSYRSVALDGDTLAVGVPSVSGLNGGYIDVFGLDASGILNRTRLRPGTLAANPSAADFFGQTVAISGNTIAASYHPNGLSGVDSSLFLFENLNDNWTTATQTHIPALGTIYGNDNRGWGYSIGLDDDTLAVGYYPIYTGYARGVYVFERNGTWANSTQPVARLTGGGGMFGSSVAVDGNRIAVGSPAAEGGLDPFTGQNFVGSDPIYLYERNNGWQHGTVNLLATVNRGSANNGTTLGWSLAMSGDTIVAGSRFTDPGPYFTPPPVFMFTGPYDFSGRSTFALNPGANLNISAASLTRSLSAGTNITLQANNDITVAQPITVNNPNGDGGDLTLQAGRRILVNASIFTDNGDLTLLAGDPRANTTYRDAGERVVVLGRDSNNVGVTLNTGTGDILINAAQRFENRTGSTNPFRFDANDPGRFLVYSTTPDQTGAPDAGNLLGDLATVGRDWVYYHRTIDVNDLTPSWLPSGNGFIYSVQPAVQVAVGDASITYGQSATASLSLTGLTLGGNSVSGTVFGIEASDLPALVTTGLDASVPVSAGGFAHAGTYVGGLTAAANPTVTTGRVYGVAVSTGAPGNLTVARATLDVRPDDAARIYGDANPTFTATYTGFVTGDSAADLDTPVTITTPAVANSNIGTYTLTGSGGADNNYQFNFTGTGLLTITARDLLLTGLVGVDRTYNGTTNAAFTGTPTIAPVNGDSLTLAGLLTATATFADRNAGSAIPITLAGITLNGTAAGNYNLILPTDLTATITPAPLTVAGLAAQNRPYDGTAAATTTGTAVVTPLGSDDVTLTGSAVAAFADKSAGTNKPVTLTGLSLTGADAANYTLVAPTLTATIAPLGLNVTGLTANNRVYNATTTATLSGTAAVTPLGGDTVSLTGTATASFADKNAGTLKPVTVAGLTLTGADAGNYALIFPTLFADITPASLTVTGLIGVDRLYDATTEGVLAGTATVAPLGSDEVTVLGTASATFADKNAGEDKALTVTGLTLGGADAANYLVVQPSGLFASILLRPITVAGLVAQSRVYDGTADVATTGTPTFGGILDGDDASFAIAIDGPTFAFADKHAGQGKTIIIGGVSLGGADAANYDTTRAFGLVADITPATLNIIGASATSRVYNATTTIAVGGGTLDGVIGADLVTLDDADATGATADKHVGADKVVTASGYVITGADAQNYQLFQPDYLTASISAFTLNLLGLNGDKTYDGLATTTLTYTGLDAVFAGDLVAVDASAVAAAYADKNAGVARDITLTGLFGLSGADAANYSLTQPGALTGTIARRSITVTGLTIADKIYDGTAAGTISGTGTFGGTIEGDDLAIDVGAIDITFADKNVGTNKTVALSGVTLSGADAANYTAATPAGITASIFAKDVTVTGLAAEDKIYDRTAVATITGTGALAGFIEGDSLGLNEANRTGAFADKNAGADKTVSVGGLVLTGLDAGNYNIVAPTLTASIARADAVLIGLGAANRVYDATVIAPLTGTASLDFGSLNNVLALSEDIALAGTAAGAFADKNVGTDKAVTVGGLELSGADARNYNLVLPTSLVATVTPADLVIAGTSIASRIYDATTGAAFANFGTIAALGADSVTLETAGATAAFADKNVGTAKAVTAGGFAITGADAANYTLVQPTGLTADITRADLLLTGVVANDRVYDGTIAAPLSGSLTIAPLGHDTVSVTGAPSATFADRNAGGNKAVTLAGLSLTGADAANYNFVLPSLVATITPRPVNLTGLSVVSRIYDGTAVATLAGTAALTNVVEGDTVGFNLSALTALFADKNVGVNKLVTLAGNALTGADAVNYEQVLPTNLTATITARLLQILGVDAVDRNYDRTTAVALTGGTLSGTVAGDSVTLVTSSAIGTMADKNVGTSKPVTVAGYTLAGADAGNYTYAQPTGVDVTIAPKTVAITGLQIADKFYDGSTTAVMSGGTLDGTISGDDVSLVTTGSSANFADPNVGLNKTVTLDGFTLGGADAANYQFPSPLTVTGNIIQSLRVITEIIPAEVLRATANAELDKQRQSLEAFNATQKNLVTLVDYTTQTAQVASGIVVPVVAKELHSIPESERTNSVNQYLSFAAAAEAASATAQALAEQYRDASAAFKELGQSINADNRALATERQLRSTYEGRIAAADAELAKARENLATIDEARRRVDTLTRQMEDAARLGRGSEVAAYEQAIAEARGILAGEAAARAQFDQLSAAAQQARDQLAESEAKIASLTTQINEKLGRIRDAEKEIKSLEQQTTQAKFAAASAAENLEMARAGVETDMRRMLGDTDQKIAELEQKGPPDLATWVEQMMARDGGESFSLSPERKQTIDNAQAAIASIDRRAAELDRTKADAQQVQSSAPATVLSVATSSRVQAQTDGKSAAELAQLDPKSLGLSDRQLLPSDSPAIQDLSRSASEVSSALGSVGRTVPVVVNGRITQVPLELEGADPARGVNNLDAPVSFSPQAEAALKSELQAYGVLPKFTNNALADLPVAAQMQIQQAMQAAKKTQDRLIAQGVDPNVAAQQAFDKKTNDLMTMVLFEAVDKYGIGDIPGVQAFVSAAIGELSAQYGVSPSGMAENLVSGNLKGLMGDGADTAKIITGQAQKIVTNPVEAGVEIFTNAVDVLKAGGAAFVDTFTGQSARDAEKAQAEAQAKFDARRNTLLSFGSKLAQLETDRQDAVAARDTSLEQVKQVIVAQAQVKEVEQALPQLANERVAAVENAKTTEEQVRREQVTATSANGIEVAKQQYAAELAQAKAAKEKLAQQLAAVAKAKPEGGGP